MKDIEKIKKENINRKIGDFIVIDVEHYKENLFKYKVQCAKCGYKKYFYRKNENQYTNCKMCNTKRSHLDEHLAILKQKYLNKKMHGFVIIDIYYKNNISYAKTECECGSITERSLYNIVSGSVKHCSECGRSKGLKIGIEKNKQALVDGTNVLHIEKILKEKRAINKNSTTKHIGVSKMKNGKYRAYLMFQRKQIYLGTFANIDDAIHARKEGEKKYYGSFLEEHKKTS